MSAFEFSIQNMIGVIAQICTGGNVEIAGLLVMLGCFFVCLIIMSSLKAPVTYSVIPMLLISIFFTAMGILSTTIGFVLIIITAVIVAGIVRHTVIGD